MQRTLRDLGIRLVSSSVQRSQQSDREFDPSKCRKALTEPQILGGPRAGDRQSHPNVSRYQQSRSTERKAEPVAPKPKPTPAPKQTAAPARSRFNLKLA